MEKNLTEKIKLCYDRKLDQTEMQLAEHKTRFKEHQETVAAQLQQQARELTMDIDGLMKKKADEFKDLDRKTKE